LTNMKDAPFIPVILIWRKLRSMPMVKNDWIIHHLNK
jgi:hypothetical protein